MMFFRSINIGTGLIILALFGCNYVFSAIACETLHDGCPGYDRRTPHLSPAKREQLLFFNLLNAHSDLIYTEQALIQPNTHPMCVVVVACTTQLAKMPEFPRRNSFRSFKSMLLANGFSVYEFMSDHSYRRIKRQIIFTHDHIRNEKSCTAAAVMKTLTDFSTFKYSSRRDPPGLTHHIWHSNVTLIGKERNDSLIDADLLDPVKCSSRIASVDALVNILNARPDLVSMSRVQIQPNYDFFCVVVIASTWNLTRAHEFAYGQFAVFKERLRRVGFTVYEYDYYQDNRHRPWGREVILTHDSFRDEAQCTIESVSRVSNLRFRGDSKIISAGNVSFLHQLQDGVGPPAILRTSPSSAPQAASGCAQASCGQHTNAAIQQSISEAKRKRQSGQAVGEDVGGILHKQPRRLLDESRSSHREQFDVGFDQSQIMELSSSFVTDTAFYYTPDASGPRNLPLSVADYRPMEYGEMSMSERDWSIRNSGPLQAIAGFDENQIALASWSEIASTFDNTPDVEPSGLNFFLTERGEMSLNDHLQSISNHLEDVSGVPHKKHGSSSPNAVRELHSSGLHESRSSHREQFGVAFDQSQMMGLSSSLATDTPFHYTPDASAPANLPQSVSDFRPMEYGEMSLSERDRSIRFSGPQQVISGFDQSQVELASWSEIAPNVSPSGSFLFVTERGEMSLNEHFESISNHLEDVSSVPLKKPWSSSSNAIRELHSSGLDESRSSHREQFGVAFDQSQMMELSSSLATDTPFHYTPEAPGPRNLPPSVSDYRPMEYGEMQRSRMN